MRHVLLLLSASFAWAASIESIAAEAKGKVSIACSLPGRKLDCNLNPSFHSPMQSVFKLPLVLAMLDRIEKGEFKLDQSIRFLPGDRILPTTFSPLQDKYPQANVDVPLREVMRLTVSVSDNAGSEILLRLLGGPRKVTQYIHSLGVKGFNLEDSEAVLHRDSKAQYRNWWEPASAVQFLRLLHDRSPLNAEHTKLLMTWMRESPTGLKRIKANLPAGTIVMHKTGTSGTHNGVSEATNDMALIVLPDGKALAIAIFVTDAKADIDTIESVIARIARTVYDQATSAKGHQ